MPEDKNKEQTPKRENFFNRLRGWFGRNLRKNSPESSQVTELDIVDTRKQVKLTLEQQKVIIDEIVKKAKKGKFNYNDLNNIDSSLHKAIALKLIEAGEGWSVARYLQNFSGLDHKETALKLIEAGKGEFVAGDLQNFSGLDHKETALKLIEAGAGWSVARYLQNFSGLDHKETALKLIEAGKGEFVAGDLQNFSGLDHKETALKLIEAGKGEFVAGDLQNFSGLDHKETALKLIEAGKGEYVARYLQNFSGLDHKETALKLIEAGAGRSVARYLQNFSGLDHKETALKLIEAGAGWSVASYLQNFSGLDNTVALKLIEAGKGWYVAKYLQNFNNAEEIITCICENDPGSAIQHKKDIEKFVELNEVIPEGLGKYIKNLNPSISEAEARNQAEAVLINCKGVEDQFGEAFSNIQQLIKSNPKLWNSLIYPTIMSQKLGSFLCLQDIKSLMDTKLDFNDGKIHDLIKYITTQTGIKGHDILKNFILAGLEDKRIQNISGEAEIIREFLESGAVPLTEIYEGYKSAKELGRPELYKEIVETTKALQQKIADGTCEDEDFSNRFFPGIVMYTFPPATGVERKQYMNLVSYREGRQYDVPEVWNEMQGKTISVSQGGYKLKEGEEFSGKAWNDLVNIVSESKGAEAKRLSDGDMAKLGKELLEALSGNKLRENQKEFLKAIYDVYRHTGKHLPDSLSGHKEIMEYKEYVGDHLNDLIGLCLQAFEKEDKEGWTMWLKNDVEKRTKSIKGIVKQIDGVVRNEKMDDEKKQEVLKNILQRFDFRVEGDILSQLRAESDNKNLEGFLKEKMQAKGGAQKYNLMIKNALLGKEYEKMYEEVQKFEFVEGAEKQDYQLFISKKKEHGCAGLNMGVCVAPDEKLWSKPDFSNVIVMKDNIAYGGMHFLVIEEDGKKYLTLPGINPNEALLGQAAVDQLFDRMMDYAKECARKYGCEKVLIPTNGGIHSNRSAIQDVIKNKNYKTFNFKSEMPFSYSPYAYSFQDCYVVG